MMLMTIPILTTLAIRITLKVICTDESESQNAENMYALIDTANGSPDKMHTGLNIHSGP